MQTKQAIQNKIVETLKKEFNLNYSASEIHLERPQNMSHGDWATNLALALTKKVGIPSREIAEKIAAGLQNNPDFIVEVAGPGFINFRINLSSYLNELSIVLEKGTEYGSNKSLQNTKVIVEYTDQNPFKEFHIGHLYSNAVGESFARLQEAMGAKVKRVIYQGDVGMHVAKSIWGMLTLMNKDNLDIKKLEKLSLNQKIEFLGKAYAVGATAYKEDEKTVPEIKEINILVYLSSQKRLVEEEGWETQIDYSAFLPSSPKYSLEQIAQLYRAGRKWSLDYFETIYKRLGTKFDNYYFESVTGEYGTKVVKKYLPLKVFTESRGAIVFEGDKHKLHTRVFINSQGLPTYEAKDLGLAIKKFEDFNYDKSIIVTSNEIIDYFKVVLKALSFINPDLAQKTIHKSHGMVNLPEGKMSSRTGKILRGEWLVDEAKQRIMEIMQQNQKSHNLNTEEVAEILAISSIKYALLKNGVGSDIAFDFNKSLSFEGDSGPYIEYTYARAKSILRDVEKSNNNKNGQNIDNLQPSQEEIILMKWLERFPEIAESAAKSYAPSLVCNYLFDLAQKFNSFYKNHSVLKAKTEEMKIFRMRLTEATSIVLQNGLDLLGIKTVERM